MGNLNKKIMQVITTTEQTGELSVDVDLATKTAYLNGIPFTEKEQLQAILEHSEVLNFSQVNYFGDVGKTRNDMSISAGDLEIDGDAFNQAPVLASIYCYERNEEIKAINHLQAKVEKLEALLEEIRAKNELLEKMALVGGQNVNKKTLRFPHDSANPKTHPLLESMLEKRIAGIVDDLKELEMTLSYLTV
ncbi:hypothetical protein [Bacillus chungangensis]|uniref:Uncharacterized protein n=1 Tax=Bacillus chungangensis TaxID=587633 RepID=A0ABT9WZ16_9BACI|nr:hypothetical protein [Bacillus chungangensis]MDQ0178467.1 hypothetical protein [Bacillus chungangensis]